MAAEGAAGEYSSSLPLLVEPLAAGRLPWLLKRPEALLLRWLGFLPTPAFLAGVGGEATEAFGLSRAWGCRRLRLLPSGCGVMMPQSAAAAAAAAAAYAGTWT